MRVRLTNEVRNFIEEDGKRLSLEELSDLLRRYIELMEISSNNNLHAQVEVPGFEAFARSILNNYGSETPDSTNKEF